MNTILFRSLAIMLHILGNIAIVIYLTGYDITGSWFRVIAFVLILFVLLLLFIRHLISFLHFLKTNT